MGTTLTFHGQDGAVALDDSTITLQGDGDPVVVLRSEVTAVDLEPATLLGYGRLVIASRDGGRHTVQFTRDAQERFADLAAIIRP